MYSDLFDRQKIFSLAFSCYTTLETPIGNVMANTIKNQPLGVVVAVTAI